MTLLPFSRCEKEPEGYGTIKGKIMYPAIGNNKIYWAPYAGSNVKVTKAGLETESDNNGNYILDGIPAGKQKLECNSESNKKSTYSTYDPNYYPSIKNVSVESEDTTFVTDAQLNPNIGYPKQILYGKILENDKKTPVAGKQIDLYMSWSPHPDAQRTMISSAITSEDGSYALYVGEKEIYFLLDREESQKSKGDKILNFVNTGKYYIDITTPEVVADSGLIERHACMPY